ncbi:sensor histidine kinase YesM [Desulfofundulus luciae]|uniref:Sensor histidine kinase YesM n=1 Tax=Desulfofundulus luciae TaxID=74702 RepID=A0ABU0AZC2_9FIRM|nr:ATP-binding protein [Desulfofundulus luciae]MDQ0285807.1 sensor histidine kinase YesM [Desulfofundulus luciae]
MTINVPAALQELPVPFLSLQPLVENACIHGLEPKEGPGHLIITGEIEDGICEISVTDDGVGIPREVLAAFNDSNQAGTDKPRGIGLKNVDERLKLYFGPHTAFPWIAARVGQGYV